MENVLRPLVLGRYNVFKIKDVFLREMELGLAKDPKRKSCLQMENTYIPGLPNGTGEYGRVFQRSLSNEEVDQDQSYKDPIVRRTR